ncbi:MAG TPA: methyl-accepting chemotaxis protein [Planctomycetota bacterium]|nr:methyl-accepting chemotaxis protein [Planctomycetota bacterium]
MSPLRQERTSMRGRLALLVFVLVAGPMLLAGSLGYSHLRGSLDAIDGHSDRAAAQVALALKATRAARFFNYELEDGLRDLADRAERLDSASSSDVAAAFGDLPAELRPSAVTEHRPHGSFDPALPRATADALRLALPLSRRQAGYLRLPDDAAAPRLHQVVLVPRDGGRTLVVLRRIDDRTAAALVAALPHFEEGVRSISLPCESAGPAPANLEGRLWSQAREQAASPGPGAVAAWDTASGAVAGAAVLSDLTGQPAALATVTIPDPGPSPLARGYNALLSEVLVALGLMAFVGLVSSMLLGLLAPRCVWGQLRGATEFIFQSVERLRELVRRNSRALDEQSDVIQRLMQSVTALRNDSQVIAETARGLAHSATQSARVTLSGNEQAELAKDSVHDLREQIGDLSAQMEDLQRRCKEIGGILSFLNHLNNETNSLSLNATIQAAGSGAGGGRQLSVMAEEIGKLAELTRASMLDIQQINERIQESSRTTLGATQEGRQEVEACLKACAELEASFGRIQKWVEETTQSAHGIESSTARQSQSLESVSTAIEALERRSRETVGNFQDVVMAAEELADLGRGMSRTWKVG